MPPPAAPAPSAMSIQGTLPPVGVRPFGPASGSGSTGGPGADGGPGAGGGDGKGVISTAMPMPSSLVAAWAAAAGAKRRTALIAPHAMR